MKTGYTDIVVEMSQKLCQVVLEQEPDLVQKVHELDGEVNKILRRVGFFVYNCSATSEVDSPSWAISYLYAVGDC